MNILFFTVVENFFMSQNGGLVISLKIMHVSPNSNCETTSGLYI